jgi:cell division protease FtsH
VLRVHARKVKFAPDADLEKIAAMTPGFAGADLANLINEAALLATRRRAAAVEMQDLTAAIERIVAGLEKKSRVLNSTERAIVAHHEMGHALVAMALPGSDPIHKISIIPRGIGALGYTMQRPTEDRFLMTREEMENKMAVLLGGRAAEMLIFGRESTGAADDFAKATDIARAMVMRFGMNEKLGLVAWEEEGREFLAGTPTPAGPRRYSEQTAREIDDAVRDTVHRAFETASAILARARALLERGARELLEKETLQEDDLQALRSELPALLGAQRVPALRRTAEV